MRQQQGGLAELGQTSTVDPPQNNRQRNGDRDVQKDKEHVVADGVYQDSERRARVICEQESEIIQSAPRAVIDEAPQEALAGSDTVFLKGDDQPEHGQITEQYVPCQCRHRQQTELAVIALMQTFLVILSAHSPSETHAVVPLSCQVASGGIRPLHPSAASDILLLLLYQISESLSSQSESFTDRP